ncbi:MAG TPA: Hsp20/alpha crystallin family protein [Polyangia bacterium]
MANIMRRGQRQDRLANEWSPIGARMRELFGWDPFAEMAPSGGEALAEFQPRFDVKETERAYVFRADLPGVAEADIDISLTGNRLTISGRREQEERRDDERWFAYECCYGSFTRAFTLPEGIDAEHVEAKLDSGVLTLTVPKRPETQPRKIALGGGAGRAQQPDKTKAKA